MNLHVKSLEGVHYGFILYTGAILSTLFNWGALSCIDFKYAWNWIMDLIFEPAQWI